MLSSADFPIPGIAEHTSAVAAAGRRVDQGAQPRDLVVPSNEAGVVRDSFS